MARSALRRVDAKSHQIDTVKVAKLVRLLASDKDGEVLAAVAALKRTLASGDADLNDLADSILAGAPRKPRAPRAPAKWAPPTPDLHNWESMAHFCRFHGRHLRDDDREFVADVLAGDTGFDLGRATPELMRRLRRIVAEIEAARDAADWW